TVHPPESFASGRIVARQLQRACDQQFLAATPLPDRRRGITAHRVGSRGFPNHPAGGAVKRRQKTVLVMVLVEDDFAINHHGRTASAVFVLKWTQWMFPKFFAIEVITDQAVAAEKHKQPPPVTRGRGGRRTPQWMSLFDALGRDQTPPKRFSGLLVEYDRGQFLRVGAIRCQRDFAVDQDRRGMSGVERYAPAQRAGRVEVIRQRAGARPGNSFVRTKIFEAPLRRTRERRGCRRRGAPEQKEAVLDQAWHARDKFQAACITRPSVRTQSRRSGVELVRSCHGPLT